MSKIFYKKSIGIHADSHAYRLDNDLIWCDLLEDKYNVTNYSRPGNSVYQVYRSLCENENKHDINIVVIPTFDRFYSKHLDNSKITEIVKNNNWYTFYENVLFYEQILLNKQELKDKNLDIINSLKTYYKLWADFDFLNDVNKLLAEKIKSKINVVTIEVQSTNSDSLGLIDISKWDLNNLPGFKEKFFNFGKNITGKINNGKWLTDNRSCHLSEDNNICLGKVVLDALEKNMKEIKLKLEDFSVPTKDAEHYLKWVYHV